MDNKKKIERLFEEQFQAYQPDPSVELWPKISRKLKWRNFMRPRWNSLNIAYVSAIVLSSAIIFMVIRNNKNTNELRESENQIMQIDDGRAEINKANETSSKNNQTRPNESSLEKSFLNSKQINRDSESNTKRHNPNSESVNQENSISIDNQNPSAGSVQTNTNLLIDPIAIGIGKPEPINQLPPRVFYIPSCDKGCAPLHLTFTNLSSEASDFSWSFGDGGQSFEMNPEYIFDEPGEYLVTLSAKNKNEEISVYHSVITVNEVPQASFMIEKQENSPDNIPVYLYNYSKGAEIYSWDFGDGYRSTDANPTHIYSAQAEYDILLKVTSVEGCIDTMILSNALNGENPLIKIPNAFSPNKNGPNGGYYSIGENNNNVFHPVIENTPVEYQLRIFNRNGNLLFESEDINIGWDGYYLQQLQPRGVYIYKLRVKFENGENIVKMGDVTIYNQD